jgi:glycosyltransferase involved in cell wall biosynthesis
MFGESMDLRFSIIIPVFNSGKFLESCLNSIAQQTYRSFEVILKDGKSSDETLSIARQFKSELNLKIISEPDSGIYDAMNKAIGEAKGEFIYFLGADDELKDNEVLEQVSGLIRSSDDIVYGNVFLRKQQQIFNGEFKAAEMFHNNIHHQSIFYRKNIFEKIGLFDTRFKLFADWHHNIIWFFSERVTHRYIPVTVANFSQEGVTSREKDRAFRKIIFKHYFKNATKQKSGLMVVSDMIRGLYIKLIK